MPTSKEIRQQFIDFFVSKGHKAVPSAPVIPQEDPTLLFTNAGMNQFKDVFVGKAKSEVPRIVDSQKCIRAGGKHNDLDEVGRDGYHHTFFEMLGNWSFGDYYKREAIAWAWELFTKVWGLDKSKLHATVHHTDQEAFDLWKEVTDIDPSHITYHGDKDNFWEMGDTGPCGPCSEINFDRGIEFCDKQDVPGHECKVNGDCQRYIELWNLVFMQYYRDNKGDLSPLPAKFVDTGAGLERICQILQKKKSNYETDLFTPLLTAIAQLSGIPYSEETGMPHRVIADHIRALSFALADGGMPSNEGRGYVLRRILRRAARNGRLLNFHEPFLYRLVDTVIEVMGHHYHELVEKEAYIKMLIKGEEERFNQTLDNGLAKLEEICKVMSGTTISGVDAFMLYDTYGFPLDLTALIAEERGLQIDEAGFQAEMELQRQRAREASQFKLHLDDLKWIELTPVVDTAFVGYETLDCEVYITKYAWLDDKTVQFQLNKTPFYGESGGQLGDTGFLERSDSKLVVTDTKKESGMIIHIATLESGIISPESYQAHVLKPARKNTARNHTATHLLHAALRKVLGDHVQQKGSLVSPNELRFDFTHFQGMSVEELRRVEMLVNEKIREALPVATSIQSLQDAREGGATALFGEKYGESVRVVTIDTFSKELCGGTHVSNTGEIGYIKILSESSSAAGIRRIEAITGEKAELFVLHMEDRLNKIAITLGVTDKQLELKLDKLLIEHKEMLKELESLKRASSANVLDSIVQNAVQVNGVSVIINKIHADSANELRQLGDTLRDKIKSGIGVLFAEIDDKVSILVVVTADLNKQYHAGKIANIAAELVGGKGGGRPDMAMAGGKDIHQIDSAISKLPSLL